MNALPLIDLLGYWMGIFLTLCILSFLYKDNPFYKFAEHLFIGVSIGYIVIQQYYNTLRPKVIDELGAGEFLALIPLVLVLMLFTKALSKRLSWIGRYPLALVVALFAGLQVNGAVQGDLGAQAKVAMQDPMAHKISINTAPPDELAHVGLPPDVITALVANRPIADLDDLATLPGISPESRIVLDEIRGPLIGLDAQATTEADGINWFGTFSNLLLFLGLLAGLVYFYFSIEHKGVIGRVSRFGVWVIMIGFGAAFGFTVMGRLALMVGRVQSIAGEGMPAEVTDRINGPTVALISLALIIGGLVLWETLNKRRSAGETGSTSDR